MKTKFTLFSFLTTLLFLLNSVPAQTDDIRWDNYNDKPYINNTDNPLPLPDKDRLSSVPQSPGRG